jgi:hypothetical protein
MELYVDIRNANIAGGIVGANSFAKAIFLATNIYRMD